ncbi:MAG: hypothetical protein V1845_03930 [bacterium]
MENKGKWRQKENQLRVELDVDSIAFLGINEKGEGKFEIVATATTKRGGRRVSESVKFCVGGRETSSEDTDSEDGTLTATIPYETKAVAVLVKVMTTGDYKVEQKKSKTLPWPEHKKSTKPRPHKLVARAEGKDGNYKIIVFVFAEDGQPINNQLVLIEIENHHTNSDGTIMPFPEIIFQEEEKKIQIHVGELVETLTLYGPQKRRAPKIPVATDSDLQGSIWQVIGRAVKQAKLLKNKEVMK